MNTINPRESYYTVKPEFLSLWGDYVDESYKLYYDEIENLANEWNKTIDELLEQLDAHTIPTMMCRDDSINDWVRVRIESDREILVDGEPYDPSMTFDYYDLRRLDDACDSFYDMGAHVRGEYAVLKSGRFTIRCKVSRL